MTVPYTFASSTGNIPLSELDANFANVSNYTVTAGTVVNSIQSNILNVGTLTYLNVNGNITSYGNVISPYYFGSGSRLSAITGANVTGQVGNALVAGTVYSAAQPNITSVGTLSVLNVNGSVQSGNILTTGLISATSNIIGGNILTNGAIIASSTITSLTNIIGQNLIISGQVSAVGNIYGNNLIINNVELVAGNIIGGNLLTGGSISAAGNISGGNILAPNSVIATNFVGGNLSITGSISSSVISAVSSITGGNLITSGIISASSTITSAANIVAGNVISYGVINAASNITGGNLLSSGIVSTTGNAIHSNLLINGTISAGGNIRGNYILGNGSQLTGIALTISGNLGGNLNSNGYYINDLPSLSVTGAIAGGNLSTSGSIFATGNIIGSNLLTGGAIISLGNIAGTYFIGNGSQLTGLPPVTGSGNLTGNLNSNGYYINDLPSLSVTGAIAGGNLSTSGSIFATGNIIGSNLLTGGAIISLGNIAGTYFIGNGSQLTGLPGTGNGITWTTQASTPPASPIPGDFWYNSTTSVKYQYINDGTSNIWVDQSFPTSFASISVGSILNSNSNGIGNIGTSATYFNTIFAKSTSAQYSDLAELYCADKQYTPGTVVEFGGDEEITISTESHSPRVAGIISTNPSYLMNSTLNRANSVKVALTGRVPCQIIGTVQKGDRLVASDIPGVAQKLDLSKYEPGCIIGKSLENYDSAKVGIIEVAVGRD